MISFNEKAFWRPVLAISWPMHHEHFSAEPKTPQGDRFQKHFVKSLPFFRKTILTQHYLFTAASCRAMSTEPPQRTKKDNGNPICVCIRPANNSRPNGSCITSVCGRNPSKFFIGMTDRPTAVFLRPNSYWALFPLRVQFLWGVWKAKVRIVNSFVRRMSEKRSKFFS